MRIADHEAADDGIGWICDGMQKYTIFEHEMPEKTHMVQIYTTFAEI